jgi:colanic acid biosynthesis glycosyl transferase WcaI
LEIIIEAAQRLSGNKTIKFVMCGNGAAYPRLRHLAEGLANIHWLALQPLEKLNELLNMADVHLLPQKADVADLVMPSKLTGMLASGKPVLATAHGGTQVANVLESIGVVVPPENTDEFTNAILDLDGNAERRNQLGKKARDYAVEYLATEAILIQFEENLKKISK